jgi:hypothetical protein
MKFGHAWVKAHGFDNRGKLPAKVGTKSKRKASRKPRPGPKVTNHPKHGTTVTYGEY